MTARTPLESGQHHQVGSNHPVPAARSLGEFSLERVGDDVILFDPASMHYHTLNDLAYRVWRLCDGRNSISDIKAGIEESGATAHVESVRLAVIQLADAGLLSGSAPVGDIRIQRRTVLRMAAAGTVVAIGLPIVSSITAPHAAAQNSTCTSNAQCTQNNSCCCLNPGHPEGTCRGIPACHNQGLQCFGE